MHVHTHTNTHIHITWPSQTPEWMCTHTAHSLTLSHAPRPHSHAHTTNILTAPQATFLPHRPTPLQTPMRHSHTSMCFHTTVSNLGMVIWASCRAAVSHGSSGSPGPQGQSYHPSAVTLGLRWGEVLRGYLPPRAWVPMEGVVGRPLWGLAEDVAGDRLAAGQPGGGSGPSDLGWRVLNPHQDQIAFSWSQAPPKDPD